MTVETNGEYTYEDENDLAWIYLDWAVKVIEERGWAQGTMQKYTGEVCALGALNIAATGEPWLQTHLDSDLEMDAYERAVSVLSSQATGSSITYTNDHNIHTVAQLKAWFARAKQALDVTVVSRAK